MKNPKLIAAGVLVATAFVGAGLAGGLGLRGDQEVPPSTPHTAPATQPVAPPPATATALPPTSTAKPSPVSSPASPPSPPASSTPAPPRASSTPSQTSAPPATAAASATATSTTPPSPTPKPQHFQAKITEYGQLALRATNEPEIVGVLWRVNELGGRSATGYFGQVILFPAAMDPARNTDIDYRIGADYFTGPMPELTEEWQWIDAEPGERDENTWYDLDRPDAPHQSWRDEMEYDLWLLEE